MYSNARSQSSGWTPDRAQSFISSLCTRALSPNGGSCWCVSGLFSAEKAVETSSYSSYLCTQSIHETCCLNSTRYQLPFKLQKGLCEPAYKNNINVYILYPINLIVHWEMALGGIRHGYGIYVCVNMNRIMNVLEKTTNCTGICL